RTRQNTGQDKPADSNTSQDTVESVEPSGAQIQEPQNVGFGLNQQTKAYLDATIQATAASIVQNMRQYMNQQLETQRE
ncbi:15334_t:CDS:1, partial [Racocetra persica]